MPEKIHYHFVQMPSEMPKTCDACPLLGNLPKVLCRPKSKYIRICTHTESGEYISNRGSHQKRGRYCPLEHLKYEYKGESYAIPMKKAEYFGLYTPPKQLKINLK